MLETMLLKVGVKLANQGNLPEAEKAFRQAINMQPKYTQAYNNLGLILYKQRRFAEAENYLEEAIKLNGDPDAYNNLALVYMDTDRLDKAEASLHKAVKAKPRSPEIYNNLGLVLEDTMRFKEAENAYRKAIKLNPDYVEAYYNLGNFLKKTHRLGNAENAYLRALHLCPGFESARFALATLYLLRGQFSQGWSSYNELRMRQKSRRQGDIASWQGEDLSGRSILLFHEQGFGDTLQFVRYAGMVAKAAAKAVLWVQPPLAALMEASCAGLQVHAGEQAPAIPFDFASSLPNLPMLFQTSADTIPREIPYIFATDAVAGKWHELLQKTDGGRLYRVGIVWAGNPKHHNDANRSIPLSVFSKLFDNHKISWVSLQVDRPLGELPATASRVFSFENKLTDFAQTAGLIKNLDLVITVDSAVAHLAGAMGKETWILLPYLPDWRWQLDRQDSPWYPTVRLFRQNKPGDWSKVIEQVKLALEGNLMRTENAD